MCVYIYSYTGGCIHMHIYIHMHKSISCICACKKLCTHVYKYMYIHMWHICIQMYVHMHKNLSAHVMSQDSFCGQTGPKPRTVYFDLGCTRNGEPESDFLHFDYHSGSGSRAWLFHVFLLRWVGTSLSSCCVYCYSPSNRALLTIMRLVIKSHEHPTRNL